MRKRRTKYTWLPVDGRVDTTDEHDYDGSAVRLVPIQVPGNGTFAAYLGPIPIVPDYTEQQTGTSQQASLRDILNGQNWLLKRIVGKLHLWALPGQALLYNSAQVWSDILVTAGFFVGRAEDANQNACELTALESDPQIRDNAMNPWIWRRSWILRNPAVTTAYTNAVVNAGIIGLPDNRPNSTMQYGSVADGPHIDSKVSRLISREHRLWFVVSAIGGDPNEIDLSAHDADQPYVGGWLDVRVLGALRKAKNSSSF